MVLRRPPTGGGEAVIEVGRGSVCASRPGAALQERREARANRGVLGVACRLLRVDGEDAKIYEGWSCWVMLGFVTAVARRGTTEPANETAGGNMSDSAGAGGKQTGGEQAVCDCGDDPMFIHAPLDCACEAGLCTTLDPNPQFDRDQQFQHGLPYVVLFGRCASGHHVLSHMEACENQGRQVFDENGQLVYSSYGPYGSPPEVCGPRDFGTGNFGIGESDPSESCDYCVLAEDYGIDDAIQGTGGAADASFGGAGGVGTPDAAGGAGGTSARPFMSCYGPLFADYEPCGPELFR